MKRKLATKILSKKHIHSLSKEAKDSLLKKFLFKVGSQALIDHNFPIHLYLELAFTCNYNCPMCPRTEAKRQPFFPLKLAEDIIYEASQYGPTSYSLHMFGEPLLHPQWDKIIETIKAYPGNVVLLTTNGSLMDKKCSQKLIDLGVDKIFVSIHSLVPGIYYKYTGGGDINKVLDNLKAFKSINQNHTKLYVRLFSNEPIRGLDGIDVEVTNYHNYGGFKKEWTALKKERKRYPCFHPWYTLAINTEGDVSVCCSDLKCDLFVGSAHKETIKEMWQGEWVNLVRNCHKNNEHEYTICKDCDQWQYRSNTFFGC